MFGLVEFLYIPAQPKRFGGYCIEKTVYVSNPRISVFFSSSTSKYLLAHNNCDINATIATNTTNVSRKQYSYSFITQIIIYGNNNNNTIIKHQYSCQPQLSNKKITTQIYLHTNP